jgi:hypothetical protein
MKTFFIAYNSQVSNNNIVTALEFLYPNHLESFTKTSASHFKAWKHISSISSLKLNNNFNSESFLSVVKNFETFYSVKNKANIMSCNYNTLTELTEFCINNNYALVTANDFFYPKNNKLVSINGTSISGEFLLLEQVK